MNQQHWIGKPWQDVLGILLPPFLALVIVIIMHPNGEVDPWFWLLVVVGVDVAHVYSTLFRTYWSVETRKKTGDLLWIIPLICFVVAAVIHSLSPIWFWRFLAYAAVWHFVRQQYGFMRLYQRHEAKSKWRWRLDELTIYAATIYPLLYWHLSADRRFHWMIQGDFLLFADRQPELLQLFTIGYFLLVVCYFVVEFIRYRRIGQLNIPKNLLIAGTIVSWYFGIVYFNGDLAFTALNVLSHGIPYLTLIWIVDHKGILPQKKAVFLKVSIYLSIVLVLAFGEEFLWDCLVWCDHPTFFGWLYPSEPIADRTWINLLVPLLALPQLVHYVLDGFIWKRPTAAGSELGPGL